ncbi:MAG: tetratricopeptide repeat protein, partial [Bacteroidales bacterium]
YYQKTLSENPKNDYAIVNLSMDYEYASMQAEGMSYLSNLLEQYPMQKTLWTSYGILCCSLDLYEKGLEAFDYAIALDPEDLGAVLNKGLTLSSMDRYEEAIALFKEVLRNHPGEVLCLMHIAECYENKEDYKNAEIYYKKVSQAHPGFFGAWYGLSICAYELGHLNKAIKYIQIVLDKDDSNAEAWNLYGEYLYEKNKIEEAFEAFERAHILQPDQINYFAAYLFTMIDMDKKAEAYTLIQTSLDKNPSSVSFKALYAAFLLKDGKMEEALDRLVEVLSAKVEILAEIKEYYPEMLEMKEVKDLFKIPSTKKKSK